MSGKVVRYFCFTTGPAGAFWTKRCKTGFSHVAVLQESNSVITCIEPSWASVQLTNYAIPIESVLELFKEHNWTVVKHEFEPATLKRLLLSVCNWYPSCVTLSKLVSGYNFMGFTPYSMYKSLIKAGATEI